MKQQVGGTPLPIAEGDEASPRVHGRKREIVIRTPKPSRRYSEPGAEGGSPCVVFFRCHVT